MRSMGSVGVVRAFAAALGAGGWDVAPAFHGRLNPKLCNRCRRRRADRMRAGAWKVLALGLLVGALALALAPALALADGDPASDVLLGQNVYYPYDPQVATSLQKTLDAETAAASRAHFPIKVALIESRFDLGAVPNLFGRPQQYAEFLDQEISFLNMKQLLLVVMPDGYGTQGLGSAPTRVVTSLKKLSGGRSEDLARAAIAAVPKLATAAGHPIAQTPGGSGGGDSSTMLTAGLLAAGAVVCAGSVLAIRRQWARPSGRVRR